MKFKVRLPEPVIIGLSDLPPTKWLGGCFQQQWTCQQGLGAACHCSPRSPLASIWTHYRLLHTAYGSFLMVAIPNSRPAAASVGPSELQLCRGCKCGCVDETFSVVIDDRTMQKEPPCYRCREATRSEAGKQQEIARVTTTTMGAPG